MADETARPLDGPPDFLQVSEAADYIGVSPQTLRRWDRDGRLPAVRRPESDYRYYRRADLEPFRLEYRRAADAVNEGSDIFITANANVEANDRLREPQRARHIGRCGNISPARASPR